MFKLWELIIIGRDNVYYDKIFEKQVNKKDIKPGSYVLNDTI